MDYHVWGAMLEAYCKLKTKLKTRNLGQSPTWVRPAPYVRLEKIRGGDKIFPASKSHGPNSNTLAYAERALSTQGRSTWAPITLFVVDGILQNFFCWTPKRLQSSTPFRFCRYLHRFQRYLRSNSKAVLKHTKFWTFFALPNLKGALPPKVVRALSPRPRATSSAKVSLGYTP